LLDGATITFARPRVKTATAAELVKDTHPIVVGRLHISIPLSQGSIVRAILRVMEGANRSVSFESVMAELAGLCELEDLTPSNGWEIDRWVLSETAVDKLVELYGQLIFAAEEAIELALADDGIDLEVLLADEEHARDSLTRSDMTELAAAASAVASDDMKLVQSVMPNVPKGSRSQSSPGIDLLAAEFRSELADEELDDDEWMLVVSVKHTIADGVDMRSKLDSSLRITLPYLTAQTRVLKGRIEERGLDGGRLFLFLADFPDGPHLRVLAVGCSDSPHAKKFVASLKSLDGSPFSAGRVRSIEIEDIAELHERVHP
jgi:hypothetical protein